MTYNVSIEVKLHIAACGEVRKRHSGRHRLEDDIGSVDSAGRCLGRKKHDMGRGI